MKSLKLMEMAQLDSDAIHLVDATEGGEHLRKLVSRHSSRVTSLKLFTIAKEIVRHGFGSRGQSVSLLTNHFKVAVSKTNAYLFHYSVAVSKTNAYLFRYSVLIKYEDDSPVDAKGIGRRILDQVYETYNAELAGKRFAYDGEKSLFSVGLLSQNKLEFTMVLADALSSSRYTTWIQDGRINYEIVMHKVVPV